MEIKEEIKEVGKDAIKQCIHDTYRKESDVQKLITNLSYKEVFAMVDDTINDDLETMIREKVIKLIDELSSYSVFRNADSFEKASKGYIIMEDETEKARPLIKERVEEIIKEYPFHELDRDEIGDIIHDCIMDRLFEKGE